MSETDNAPHPNGDLANNEMANGEGDTMPSATAIAQYIKDMSVENPSSPTVFQWQVQPQLDVQFNINVNRIAEEVHEVILKIALKAASDQGTHFVVELAYAGLFGLRNIPDDALPPFLLIEAPRLLFPFARAIVAEQTQNLGFPAVLLDPIDFAAAYMANMPDETDEAAAAAAEPAPGNA